MGPQRQFVAEKIAFEKFDAMCPPCFFAGPARKLDAFGGNALIARRPDKKAAGRPDVRRLSGLRPRRSAMRFTRRPKYSSCRPSMQLKGHAASRQV